MGDVSELRVAGLICPMASENYVIFDIHTESRMRSCANRPKRCWAVRKTCQDRGVDRSTKELFLGAHLREAAKKLWDNFAPRNPQCRGMNLYMDSNAIDTRQIIATIRNVMDEPDALLPLHTPVFGANAETYVAECVRTGWVSSVGKFVDRFEEDLANYTGVKRVVAVVNGTAALHIAQLLCGVVDQDEVLIPSLTFIATANSVKYCNATPHFVDISTRTLGVDPHKLDSYLAEIADMDGGTCVNRKTGKTIRAMIGVHTFGHPFEVDQIQEVCKKYNLQFIEDAAESIGSFYKNKHTGGLSDIGIISFNGNKTITTGGGGAILTNDEGVGKTAKHITTTGKVPHAYEYVHDVVAYNYRMPNINAALGCSQLEDVEELIASKRRIAKRYISAFSSLRDLEIFSEPESCRSNYWLNTMILSRQFSSSLVRIIEALNQADIQVRPIWKPLHTLDMFKNCPRMDLTNTLDLGGRIINLPSTPRLSGN